MDAFTETNLSQMLAYSIFRGVEGEWLEMDVLSNRYGLNQFDLLSGIVPWLIVCQNLA
jgi:hypothetical protein